MNLPNFLIVGAQKCGTTSLHDILRMHPEANMSAIKEINYFTSPEKQEKGLNYYASFFSTPTGRQKVTGEATPGYMCYPGVAERIYEMLGDIKIVMILRDPIKRAYSQYWDNRRHLSETMSEDQIVKCCLSETYVPGSRGYFSRGIYIKYIDEYLKYFRQEKLHIMLLEDLIQFPEYELKKLFDFLEISSSQTYTRLSRTSNSSMVWLNPFYKWFLAQPQKTKYLPVHARRLLFWGKQVKFKYPSPSSNNLLILRQFYKPWNDRLAAFLGRNLEIWENNVC